MKYYKTAEFLALRVTWLAALKENGFVDLETSSGELKNQHHALRLRRNATRQGDMQSFFAKLDGWLSDHRHRMGERDREILVRWSAGEYLVSIARSVGCAENTVRRAVKKYKKLILSL